MTEVIGKYGATAEGTLIRSVDGNREGSENKIFYEANSSRNNGELSHLTCVLTDGRRMFLGRRTSSSGNEISDTANSGARVNFSSDSLTKPHLLSRSMLDLIEDARLLQVASVARAQQRRLLEESRKGASIFGAAAGSEQWDEEDHDQQLQLEQFRGSHAETDLWVKKHSPKNFSQLLSSERTNRDVLKAVKRWDPFVFHKDENISTVRPDSNNNSNSGWSSSGFKNVEQGDSSGGHNTQTAPSGSHKRQSSDDSRPEQKVILLCGPPGTGKTTLAYIVAKHCGYRPFEINASDDRSPTILYDNISRALHGNTLSKGQQPNCVILDEIDGIDSKASVDILIKIIQCPLKRKGSAKGNKNNSNLAADEEGWEDGEDAEASDNDEERVNKPRKNKNQLNTKTTNSKKSGLALTRPLICICNDQYAPVLRDLRKHCLIYAFQSPHESRLISRLQAICIKEKLQVGSTALSSLVSASAGDIRSSLNTLQFAALRLTAQAALGAAAQQPVTHDLSSVLQSMISHGLKDQNRDVFQIWRETFSVHAMNASIARMRNGKLGKDASLSGHFYGPIMQAVQSMSDYGDSQLVLRGIFHNILKIRFSDAGMTRSAMATDWISGTEVLESKCFDSGVDGFALMSYVPAVAGAVYLACATDGRPKIEWPSTDREQSFKRVQHQHILQSLQTGSGHSGGNENSENGSDGIGALRSSSLSPTLRGRAAVACDVLSHLINIISPRVRPVAFTAMSAQEQAAIMHAVRVMASTGLSYHMQRGYDVQGTSYTSEGFSKNRSGVVPVRDSMHNMDEKSMKHTTAGAATLTAHLMLEPAIDRFVDYKHFPISASSFISSNNHSRYKLPYEIRYNIFMELKRYLIQLHAHECVTPIASEHGIPVGTSKLTGPTALVSSTPPRAHGDRVSENDSHTSAGSKRGLSSLIASPQATLLVLRTAHPPSGASYVSTNSKHETAPQSSSAIDAHEDGFMMDKRARVSSTTSITSGASVTSNEYPIKKHSKLASFFKLPTPTPEQNKPVGSVGVNILEPEPNLGRPTTSVFKLRSSLSIDSGAEISSSQQTIAVSLYASVNSIRFKFNQGFSNAVRRPVCVNDFA